jgi:hypothetical protein
MPTGPAPVSANAKRCDPIAGQILVCNAPYGQRGWLGIASIWLSNGHISQGTTKLNDTYFSMARYNTDAWRQFVTCQEVGHDFGLAHQDENNNNTNLGSCMDYTAYPDGGGTGGSKSNRAPNAHDYAQLDAIYDHVDSANSWFSTYGIMTDSITRSGTQMPALDIEVNQVWQWGTPVAWDDNGRPIRFERDLGGISANHGGEEHPEGPEGTLLVTDVFWAPVDPFVTPDRGVGRPSVK